MKIYSVTDKEFAPYGRAVTGYDTAALAAALAATPLPEAGTAYMPRDESLHAAPGSEELAARLFGGMPAQLGRCSGRNTKLNCLEYHRDSEFNLGTHDFILLLAKQDEIENGVLDTSKVKAFRVPAGMLIEVYATTLHYAPCHVNAAEGFRVLVALPPERTPKSPILHRPAATTHCSGRATNGCWRIPNRAKLRWAPTWVSLEKTSTSRAISPDIQRRN